MKIVFFTRYSNLAASTRYRFSQYFSIFEKYGYSCQHKPLLPDEYLINFNSDVNYSLIKLIICYIRRIMHIFSVKKNSIIFIHSELLPYLPETGLYYWFKLRNVSVIVDYDDAIYHTYQTHYNKFVRYVFKDKIKGVAKKSECVITGSPYLTNYFKQFHKKVVEIPTSIDLDLYPIPGYINPPNNFIVGWIGSKSTSEYLLSIIEPLDRFSKKYSINIHLIGFDKKMSYLLPSEYFRIMDWHIGCDFDLLMPISVGIMPLTDGLFEKGKCGFKLIQYMACGKPFIASPFEANLKIDHNRQNLFATTSEEWFNALETVYHNQYYFSTVGINGRKVVEDYYSLQANNSSYLKIFNSLSQ
ncbi:glycosyltransferase [Larkinella sp. C7]|uniref:glycosyltransferase n=1 Tax=Larkinella sp. C7 TaxID=2576607 RepID=UPI0011113D96|nr:glycosyltransferase [Larkinella sp. C7]